MSVEAQRTVSALDAAELNIIDDDDDLRGLLALILESRGFHVREAQNGHEGLRLVADRAPALILLDVDMPVLDGPDMAAAILEHDRGLEEIPILLVSGNVRLAATADAIGTPYFLEKPYSVDAILQLVDRALVERTAPRPQDGRVTR